MHSSQCKGIIKKSVITKEINFDDIKFKIFSFPIEICSECGEYTTNLADGVKVHLYIREMTKNKRLPKEKEIGFNTITQYFEGKDIVAEIMDKKQN